MDDVVELTAPVMVTWGPDRTPRRIRADAKGLHVDGALFARAGLLARGTIQRQTDGALVVLTTSQKLTCAVGPLTEDDARRLLVALRLDPGHRATVYRRSAPAFNGARREVVVPCLLAVASLALCAAYTLLSRSASEGPVLSNAETAAIFLPPFLVLALASLLAWVLGTRFVVGGDGVLLRRFGRARRVPYAAIKEVRPDLWRGGIELRLRDGETLAVPGPLFEAVSPFGASENARPWVPRVAHECASRVALGMALSERGGATEGAELPGAALVARNESDTARWVAWLKSLPDRQPFRDASVSKEELWDLVLRAPDRLTRAAAAVALTPGLDADGRARLRVAADAVVTPKLRVALEAAAEGKDERLAGALEELEAEERETAAKT